MIEFICSSSSFALQKANNKDDMGQVIILFQDMLEVVMRDIMKDIMDEQLSG
jgi:callose synthase